MGRTTYTISRADFVADQNSVDRSYGYQIDWTNVGAGYLDASTGKHVLPAGTVVGSLLGAGKVSPRVLTTNPAIGILATTAIEGDRAAGYGAYQVYLGGVVYENLLPDSTGAPKVLPAAFKTEMASAGCTFKFQQYADNRT
jgi:hypothetical protein